MSDMVKVSDEELERRRELVVAYVQVQAECWFNQQPVFRIGDKAFFCSVDYQWQHPEHDGRVRTIKDKTGVVVCQSLTASWAELHAVTKIITFAKDGL